jgi:hypothetical protein
MLQIVRVGHPLGRSSVSERSKQSEDGCKELQDEPRSGRPSTFGNTDTIANVREMAARDSGWALRITASQLNTDKAMISQILHEHLQKGKICAKPVSHRLRDEHRKQTGINPFVPHRLRDGHNRLASIRSSLRLRDGHKRLASIRSSLTDSGMGRTDSHQSDRPSETQG